MFAVVETGGKQYRVKGGDIIHVERLTGKAGEKIRLEKVLCASDGSTVKVGAPAISGAYVTAEVLGEEKADKVIIFKKKRRHNYRRKKGHRHILTALQVTSITVDGKTVEAEIKKPAHKAAKSAAPASEKATKTTKPAEGKAKTASKPAAKAKAPAAKKTPTKSKE